MREITKERTVNAKMYDAGGGQRQAKIYAAPIHYTDSKGVMQDIDLTPCTKSVSDSLRAKYAREITKAPYRLHYSPDKAWDYRMEAGDSFVEFKALFEPSDDLSVDVQRTNMGVKETITLHNGHAPTKLQWEFARSGSGIHLPEPTAVDAEGKPVSVKVSEKARVLTYEIDTAGAVFPIEIDPTSEITAANDGYAYSNNSTYTTARNAGTGTGNTDTLIIIGQQYATYTYSVRRGFLSFSIPGAASVSACSLFLYGDYDGSTVDFDVYIHTSTYTNPLAKEDFDLFDGHEASGQYSGTILNDTWNSADFLSADWNEFTFNNDGLTAVLGSQGNTFKVAMLSKEDYDSSQPGSDTEWVRFNSSYTEDKEPYLSITYTPPPTPVAVGGTLTMSGALAKVLTAYKGIGGELEPTGALTRALELYRSMGGELAPTGALAKVLTAYQSIGGTLTPDGVLAAILILTESVGGDLTLSGALSARNPAWELLDAKLKWMGEWDEAYSYDIYDVVLYKTTGASEWHVFMSKISHNTGNIPTVSPVAWRRLYQEQFE